MQLDRGRRVRLAGQRITGASGGHGTRARSAMGREGVLAFFVTFSGTGMSASGQKLTLINT